MGLEPTKWSVSDERAPEKSRPGYTAAVVTGSFTALLWFLEIVDRTLGNRLQNGGIEPRDTDGLSGILFAPLLHDDWSHLIANTLPVLVLCFLTLVTGLWRGIAATAIIWIVGGAGTWLTGDAGVHIGASILIFGWITYLILQGLFTRRMVHVLLGVGVFVLYGSALWGVLPTSPQVSWQGHLFGAVGGVLAAWAVSPKREPTRPQRPAFDR